MDVLKRVVGHEGGINIPYLPTPRYKIKPPYGVSIPPGCVLEVPQEPLKID
jgi:hypothetical protein